MFSYANIRIIIIESFGSLAVVFLRAWQIFYACSTKDSDEITKIIYDTQEKSNQNK